MSDHIEDGKAIFPSIKSQQKKRFSLILSEIKLSVQNLKVQEPLKEVIPDVPSNILKKAQCARKHFNFNSFTRIVIDQVVVHMHFRTCPPQF